MIQQRQPAPLSDLSARLGSTNLSLGEEPLRVLFVRAFIVADDGSGYWLRVAGYVLIAARLDAPGRRCAMAPRRGLLGPLVIAGTIWDLGHALAATVGLACGWLTTLGPARDRIGWRVCRQVEDRALPTFDATRHRGGPAPARSREGSA